MKKIALVLFGIVLALGIAGFVVRRQALEQDAAYLAYNVTLDHYYDGVELLENGYLDEAEQHFSALLADIEKHTDDPYWESLRKYHELVMAHVAYARAERQWEAYVRVFTTNSQNTIPNPEEILDGYKKLETAFANLAAYPEFSDPSIAWRLKNGAATALTWQLIGRWAMLESTLEDLFPIYKAAFEGFKQAMPLAERATQVDTGFPDTLKRATPERIVSQNLDFMSRLDEAMRQQQQQQQQQGEGQEGEKPSPSRTGLGDFLMRAMMAMQQGQGEPTGLGQMLNAQGLGQQKFLPLPARGIGTSRLPQAGQK